MSDTAHIPAETEVRAKWGGFAWTKENANTTAILGALDIVFGECDR
ncbi:MAG: hypothetical protein ABI668_03435 [Sphingorhabdus sp.]